jgi:RHS repeat-associated protein
MNKTYNFSFGSGDNGNVASITNCLNTTRSQSFTYDALNRLVSGQSSGTQWVETFTIDAWGNLTNESQIAGKTNHEGLNAAPASVLNQLTGFGYDAAGNMTSNGTTSYVYDAENRLIWTSGIMGDQDERYIYDGDGKRVEKCAAGSATIPCPSSGTTGTLYWKGTGSDTVDETDLAGNPVEEYIFFNGERIARRDVTSTGATIAVHYYFSDHLGSHSVVENATGTACEQDIDYYPYGGVENDYCTTPVAQHYKFTGKERDAESGLDMFGARYYGSSLGRFMTPDWAAKPTNVPYASFGNPQSLNLYSYVNNNPTTTRDPDGHCAEDACVVEGSAALLYIGGAALVAGTAAVLNTPAGQRSLSTFTSAASQSISDTVHAIGNFFHPDNSGKAASPPGKTTTNVATGTPASTSQQGAVDTSPKSLIVASPGGDAIPVPNGASGTGASGQQCRKHNRVWLHRWKRGQRPE